MALTSREKINQALREQRVPPAWLFIGADLGDMLEAARTTAQALVCEKANLAEACGECGPCRRIVANSSESFILIEPEKNAIRIETVRDVLQQLSLALLGRARVVVINQANLLNPQAANALLKAIEEPPPHTHFILIAQSQESILRTLRSRSQLVYFAQTKSLSAAERLQQLAADPTYALATQAWQFIAEANPAGARDFIRENISGREEALVFVRHWHELVRQNWAQEPRADRSEILLQAERDLLGNCEAQLTLENVVNQFL